jgi:hypothetical protein
MEALMYWKCLFLLFLQSIIFPWIFTFLVLPAMGLMGVGFVLTDSSKPRSSGRVTGRGLMILGIILQWFVVVGWVANCVALVRSCAYSEGVEYRFLYFITGYFLCMSPLQYMARYDPQNDAGCGAMVIPTIAYVLFCLWPSLYLSAYGWAFPYRTKQEVIVSALVSNVERMRNNLPTAYRPDNWMPKYQRVRKWIRAQPTGSVSLDLPTRDNLDRIEYHATESDVPTRGTLIVSHTWSGAGNQSISETGQMTDAYPPGTRLQMTMWDVNEDGLLDFWALRVVAPGESSTTAPPPAAERRPYKDDDPMQGIAFMSWNTSLGVLTLRMERSPR